MKRLICIFYIRKGEWQMKELTHMSLMDARFFPCESSWMIYRVRAMMWQLPSKLNRKRALRGLSLFYWDLHRDSHRDLLYVWCDHGVRVRLVNETQWADTVRRCCNYAIWSQEASFGVGDSYVATHASLTFYYSCTSVKSLWIFDYREIDCFSFPAASRFDF